MNAAEELCASCKGTGIGYGKARRDDPRDADELWGWLETDCSDCDGTGEAPA